MADILSPADRAWKYVAAYNEAHFSRLFDSAARWLIDRGWLVGPEGGWFREFRWRRTSDPPHPWRTNWTEGFHEWILLETLDG